MPYIKEDRRQPISTQVSALRDTLVDMGSMEGDLNYVISRLLTEIYQMGNPNYDRINKIMGILESVKSEFYERIASKYEKVKYKENGDLPAYAEFDQKRLKETN